MRIDKTLFDHIEQEHKIVLWKLDAVAMWSQAKVIKRQDISWKFYVLKRPHDQNIDLAWKDLLYYQYQMADQFFTSTWWQQPRSYAVGMYKDKPYHLMDRCEGTIKHFADYTRDDIVVLAKSLAELHNMPINKHIQSFQHYHDTWREYLFHRDGVCGIFDRTAKVYPYTLSSDIVRELSKFYRDLWASRTTITMIHGDLSSNNIVVDEDSMSFIDPHVVQYGDPIIDVGRILFGIEYSYRHKQESWRESMQTLFLKEYARVRQDETLLRYVNISKLYSIGLFQAISIVEENKHHHKELYQWLKKQVETLSL